MPTIIPSVAGGKRKRKVHFAFAALFRKVRDYFFVQRKETLEDCFPRIVFSGGGTGLKTCGT
ncbi:MAG TPA: hypothetical protein VIT23_15535, partial [Terrimicrobiaceae bacterium]